MNNLFPQSVCFYHVTYVFQSESTLYSCLNVKELLARSRREIQWVRIQLQSLHLQISRLLRARSSLTFRQL